MANNLCLSDTYQGSSLKVISVLTGTAVDWAHIDAELDKAIVHVLATQMGVSCRGLDLKDALIDGQERHIKGAAPKVKDQHLRTIGGDGCLLHCARQINSLQTNFNMTFISTTHCDCTYVIMQSHQGMSAHLSLLHSATCPLLVKAVCNGRCCWLVDDAQNIQTSNGSRILCCLHQQQKSSVDFHGLSL